MDNETYLGDGLYASFDGFQIRLRAPRCGREDTDHCVYLEPSVYAALCEFGDKYIAISDSPIVG